MPGPAGLDFLGPNIEVSPLVAATCLSRFYVFVIGAPENGARCARGL